MEDNESTSLLIHDHQEFKPTEEVYMQYGIWGSKAIYTRWQSFAGICMIISMAGTTYAFGVYSPLLVSTLGFSQTETDIVASVGNTGLYLSIFVGFGVEKFGLRAVVFTGAMMISVGFLYIWLAVQSYIPANVASISIFFFISQLGVCCHVASAVTCAIRNFPSTSRGSSVGLAKGYFGLSSAVLSDFDGSLFTSAAAGFLLFVSTVVPFMGFLGSSLTNFLPQSMIAFTYEKRRGLSTSFMPFYIHWICLFLLLLSIGYIEYAFDIGTVGEIVLTCLLGLLLLSLLLIPSIYGDRILCSDLDELHRIDQLLTIENKMNKNNSHENLASENQSFHQNNPLMKNSPNPKQTSAPDTSVGKRKKRIAPKSDFNYDPYSRSDSILSVPESHASHDEISTVSTEPPNGKNEYESFLPIDYWRQNQEHLSTEEEMNELDNCYYGMSLPVTKAIKTWRFWSLYFVYFTVSGTGLMVIDNIDAIADALGISPSTFFVTLVSLANGAGRFIAGISSDHLLKYYSKLQLMSVVAFLMGVAHSLFAIGNSAIIYPCLLMVGFLFGAIVALIAVNIADIFGSRYVATNFGAVDSAPILGSYFFVTWIVSLVYETNSVTDDGSDTCIGVDCFRDAFIVNSSFCYVAAIVCYFCHLYTPIVLKTNGH